MPEYIARISYGKDSLKMLDVIFTRDFTFGQDHHHRCMGNGHHIRQPAAHGRIQGSDGRADLESVPGGCGAPVRTEQRRQQEDL